MTAIDGHANSHKDSDESVASSIVLQDDDDIKFDVKAGEKWQFRLIGFVTTPSVTPDFKFAFNGPAFTYLRMCLNICDIAGVAGAEVGAVKSAWDDALEINYSGAADDRFQAEGYVEPSADGTVVLRWAQRVSDAGATVVKQGTVLRAVREA